MAGIYIKGMEMPRACVWREDGHLRTCPLYDIDGYCGAINSEACHKEEEPHPDCPLIPAPDHGRLVDADALDASVLQAGFSYAITRRKLRYTPGEVRQKIANAPTIIPAEKKEEK